MPMKPEHLIDCCERCGLPKPDDVRQRSQILGWWVQWTGDDHDLGLIAVALCRYDSGNRMQAPFMAADLEIGKTDADLDYSPEPYVALRLSGPLPENAWAGLDRIAAEQATAA